MALQYFWIVSLSLRSVLYLRRFPNVEKRAERRGLPKIAIKWDQQLVDSVLSSLAITRNSELTFDCCVANQLPVIELSYDNIKIWPVIVIEQNGLLFCCHPLCETDSRDLIDEKSIAMCFTTLQMISRHFTIEKGLSWIEWFFTSMAPFGTLIAQDYEPLNKVNKKQMKTDKILQNDFFKLFLNELISRSKDREIVFGTVSYDQSFCSPQIIQNSLLSVKLRNPDSLNLVFGPNWRLIGDRIQLKPKTHLNPLDVIYYKCGSDSTPIKTFLSYNYTINQKKNQKNVYEINLTLSLKNWSQFRFSSFSIQFMHTSDNCLTPIKSSLSFGQLRFETKGLSWVIGSKFHKSGQISLNFEIVCPNNDLLSLETFCNFKVDNFQTSLMYTDSQHLTVDDINIEPNSKISVIVESTLTAIDYKLFPEFN